MEIRCAVGPGSVLLARASDPAEDPRPRPRRHTEPVNGNTPKHHELPHTIYHTYYHLASNHIITIIISFFFFLYIDVLEIIYIQVKKKKINNYYEPPLPRYVLLLARGYKLKKKKLKKKSHLTESDISVK